MSTEIKRVEKYQYNGKEYRTLRDIRTEIENDIGRIVDDITKAGIFGPKHRIKIHEGVIKNHEVLCRLLSVVTDQADDAGYKLFKNILDI